jgi:hypothetical protein
MARLRGERKLRFAEQCFARVWPKAIHGFGVGTREILFDVPWHSVDAMNWEIGPGRYGRWKAFYGARTGIYGSDHDLRIEVAHHLESERLARHRWRREMERFGQAPGSPVQDCSGGRVPSP